MRKTTAYLKFFWMPILLLVIAIFCWFYTPDTIGNFKAGLLGTALGVAISLFAAESFKKVTEHKRVKKTFGFLKLVTIHYLKNQAENFSASMQIYRDPDKWDCLREEIVLDCITWLRSYRFRK